VSISKLHISISKIGNALARDQNPITSSLRPIIITPSIVNLTILLLQFRNKIIHQCRSRHRSHAQRKRIHIVEGLEGPKLLILNHTPIRAKLKSLFPTRSPFLSNAVAVILQLTGKLPVVYGNGYTHPYHHDFGVNEVRVDSMYEAVIMDAFGGGESRLSIISVPGEKVAKYG